MVSARIGDRVVCKLRAYEIVVASERKYDDKRVFEVIGVNAQGWFLYVPPYITIKGSAAITKYSLKDGGIDPKFIGWDTIFITSSFLVEVQEQKPGMVCQKCNEFFEHSEANQEDGTMICWGCRNYRKWGSYVEDDDY